MNILTKRKKKEAKKKEKVTTITTVFCKLFLGRDSFFKYLQLVIYFTKIIIQLLSLNFTAVKFRISELTILSLPNLNIFNIKIPGIYMF